MHQNIINHINSKQVQYNRTDHYTHEHHDIRRKPNVGENHLLQFVSFFFNKKLLLQCTGAVLYQYAGYNLQRATTLLALVLADPFTST